MKKFILAVAAMAAMSGFAAADTVRIATEGKYPPFNNVNDQGKVEGYDVDVGNEICKRAGLTCEFITNDWDSIIPNLVSGNYDAIIAGMSITDERSKVISFTEAYYPQVPSVYVAKTADANIKGNVAAQTSTIQAGYVAESGATLVEFATPDETVAAVRNGEADAVFADKDFLSPIVDASAGELTYVGEPVSLGNGVGIGMRQSDTELKAKFDKAISEMKADGTLNGLIDHWFGKAGTKF